MDKVTDGAQRVAARFFPTAPPLIALEALSWVVTVVIASLGIHGTIGAIPVGATMIGLTTLSVIANRLELKPKHWGKTCIISRMAFSILFGTLAMTGVMATSTVGWIMLTPTVLAALCLGYALPYAGCAFGIHKAGLLKA